MIQSQYPQCPKHQIPIRFIDLKENIPKTQRTLCDECYLNNPIAIHQAIDYLQQQQNQPYNQNTILESYKEEYLVIKNVIIENLKQAFAQIELEIDKEMNNTKTVINDSVFQYFLGKQSTLLLEDYQGLGELLSIQIEKKGENLIQKQNTKNSQIQFREQLQKNINILKEISQCLHKIIPYVKYIQEIDCNFPQDILAKADGEYILKQQLGNIENVKCIDYHNQLQILILGCYKFEQDSNEMMIIKFDKTFNICLKQEYTSHQRTVTCLKSSNLSNFCISGSEDNTLKIWKIVQDGIYCDQTLEGHQDSIICFCLNRSENILTSGSMDTNIVVWYQNVQNKWQKGQTIVDCPKITLCININRQSNLMITGCIDHSISIWSLINEKWRCNRIEKAHNKSVNAISFINSSRFASGSWDSTIKIWDRQNTNQNYGQIVTIGIQKGPILNLILIEESNLLISCAFDTTIIWQIDNGQELIKKQKIAAAKSICQTNKEKLSIINYDNSLKIYQLEQ